MLYAFCPFGCGVCLHVEWCWWLLCFDIVAFLKAVSVYSSNCIQFALLYVYVWFSWIIVVCLRLCVICKFSVLVLSCDVVHVHQNIINPYNMLLLHVGVSGPTQHHQVRLSSSFVKLLVGSSDWEVIGHFWMELHWWNYWYHILTHFAS